MRSIWRLAGAAAIALALPGPAPAFEEDFPTFEEEFGEDLFASWPGTRQTVPYAGGQAPGTIVVNTEKRRLYYVLEGGKAIRYGIGVGREGFQWSGRDRVSRKAKWPGWTPPAEMRARQPGLPEHMPGGPRNPLGARALYIGATLYRIHGTDQAETIGRAVSSGCIRMLNEDVIDLFKRVEVGAPVIVM